MQKQLKIKQLKIVELLMMSGKRNTKLTSWNALLMVCLAVAFFMASLSSSSAHSRRRAASTAPKTRWANVIVVFRGDCTPQRKAILRKMGADVYRHLPLIRGVAVRVPARLQKRIAALPFVAHLSPDLGVKKCDEFTMESSGATTAYQQTGLTGAGVTVAVLDSGIQHCVDLT